MNARDQRAALATLPKAAHTPPGAPINAADVYVVPSHRNALDPERPLVVGNRGMGKSFWAHVLADQTARERAAREFRVPGLEATRAVLGFYGSDAIDPVAPTRAMLDEAQAAGADPDDLWRAVLVRAVAQEVAGVPERYRDVVAWLRADTERYAHVLTLADRRISSRGDRLLLVFDALDRLAGDWRGTRQRLEGLLRVTLGVQSFRSIRIKLFLRNDQFEDQRLFTFTDASKLRNASLELRWRAIDLYRLVFHYLRSHNEIHGLVETAMSKSTMYEEVVVEALAGKFMGASKKRGHVYSWIPTHLADARGDISPRTFLTSWRVAAERTSDAAATAVDVAGIHEGVREASRDRLSELREDYPWVDDALTPLRDRSVPIEREALEDLWREHRALFLAAERSASADRPIWVPFNEKETSPERQLLSALVLIGVCEVRRNGKVNVPDIFRVEAGIKRKGGVKLPDRMGRR